ncbi:MAG: hypothetical protein ABEJ61_00805 [Haloferacaceae archaeon]
MDERAQELADRCRDRFGETLRAVYTYGPDEHTIVYKRDDIDYGYTDARLGALLDGVHDIHERLRGMGTGKEPLGAPEASIQAFEHAFIVQYVEGERGVAVAVDADAAPEVAELVDACPNLLPDER